MNEIELKALAAKLESNALAYEMLGEKQLPALLREAAAALAPRWQAIEFAPKAEPVLTYGSYGVRPGFHYDGGWFSDGDGSILQIEPTHFQPLPAPPEVEG